MSPFIDAWNQGARLWWSWCLHSTWQGLVLLALVLAVLPLLKRTSPHWRYALLFVALLKFLLPPLGMEGYGLFAWLFPPPSIVQADFGPLDRFQHQIVVIENYAAEAPTPVAQPKPPIHPLTPAGWGLVIHVLGSFALFVFLTVQVVRLRFRLKRAQWVTGGPLFNSVASVGQALSLRRIPRVYVSSETESPCAVGTMRKFVLLPGWVDLLTDEERRVLLAHELAHLKRWDTFCNWFQILSQVWLWWNPAVWWLNSRIRAERELCCDDLVLSLGFAAGGDYSRLLVDVASRQKNPELAFEAMGMADSFRRLKERIDRAMDSSLRRRTRLSMVSAAVLVAIAVAVLPGARINSQAVQEGAMAGTDAVPESAIEVAETSSPAVASVVSATSVSSATDSAPALVTKEFQLNKEHGLNFPRIIHLRLFGSADIIEASGDGPYLKYDESTGILTVRHTPDRVRLVQRLIDELLPEFLKGIGDPKRELKARKFTVFDVSKQAPGEIEKRKRAVEIVTKDIRTELYGEKSIEKAAAEGRIIYPDPEKGTIDVIDTIENLKKVEDYLAAFTGQKIRPTEDGVDIRKYVTPPKGCDLSKKRDWWKQGMDFLTYTAPKDHPERMIRVKMTETGNQSQIPDVLLRADQIVWNNTIQSGTATGNCVFDNQSSVHIETDKMIFNLNTGELICPNRTKSIQFDHDGSFSETVCENASMTFDRRGYIFSSHCEQIESKRKSKNGHVQPNRVDGKLWIPNEEDYAKTYVSFEATFITLIYRLEKHTDIERIIKDHERFGHVKSTTYEVEFLRTLGQYSDSTLISKRNVSIEPGQSATMTVEDTTQSVAPESQCPPVEINGEITLHLFGNYLFQYTREIKAANFNIWDLFNKKRGQTRNSIHTSTSLDKGSICNLTDLGPRVRIDMADMIDGGQTMVVRDIVLTKATPAE